MSSFLIFICTTQQLLGAQSIESKEWVGCLPLDILSTEYTRHGVDCIKQIFYSVGSQTILPGLKSQVQLTCITLGNTLKDFSQM